MYFRKNIIRAIFYVLGFLIAFGTLFYTNNLFSDLQKEEKNKVKLFAKALKSAGSPNVSEAELAIYWDILQMNSNIPILIFDTSGHLIESKNVTFKPNEKKLGKIELLSRKKMQKIPIKIEISKSKKQYIYYGYSPTLYRLQYMPFIQLFLIILLVVTGYILYQRRQQSRQNSLWAGLSKETAHQLGTPISSLIAWIELMKAQNIAPKYLPEIQKDVQRLKIVSNRFSQIGSPPSKKLQNIVPLIEETANYMNSRTSKLIEIYFDKNIAPIFVEVNEELFVWVIENLLKNGVDAIKNKGKITITAEELTDEIKINVADTGKGIPPNMLKKIFEPGFTTKQRGWGLGLSLTKRIIEDFHNGRIFAKNSQNSGAIFRIILPKSKKEEK